MPSGKRVRVWIEILGYGTLVAFGIAMLLATLGAVAGVAEEPRTAQTGDSSASLQIFEGMLSCSRCGAKHSSSMGRNAADCVRICAHMGSAFALVQGESIYRLEGDSEALKRLAARRVRVSGALQGDTIRVSSVATAD